MLTKISEVEKSTYKHSLLTPILGGRLVIGHQSRQFLVDHCEALNVTPMSE